MANVKVSIVNNYTLKLEEDAKKNDLIDLRSIDSIDTSIIIEKIKSKQDQVYLEKLEDVKKQLSSQHQLEINEAIFEYENKVTKLEEQLKQKEESIKQQLTIIHNNEVNKLNNEITKLQNLIEKNKQEQLLTTKEEVLKYENKITKLEEQLKQKEEIVKQQLTIQYNNEINNLKASIEKIKQENEIKYLQKINEMNTEKQKLESELQNFAKDLQLKLINQEKELKEHFEEIIRKQESQIEKLTYERASLNVKTQGENLEKWCDNEFNAHNLIQNNNIVWEKANEVIKGSKPDFIYKVYATEEKLESQLLASAVLEMKAEDPTSTNRQTNKSHLAKLDRDRNNRNLEYAILVSELEWDTSNDVPIKKVLEYEKMFIVRPQFFMTLLSIITAFGLKYKDILLAKEEEKLAFKDITDILEEFEQMKAEILDNSIRHINTQLEEIMNQSNNISKANDKIQKATKLILETHLQTVINKINNFNISSIVRKIEKQ